MNQATFMLQQMLAAVNTEHVLTADQHAMREQALESLPDLIESGEAELSDLALEQMLSAYFLCTYAHTPKKHEIKKVINRVLRDNLIKHGVLDWADYHVGSKSKGKPRVLILTNHFSNTHVMYRCFGKSLTAMKKDFECVALSLGNMDYITAQCFHRVLQVNVHPSMNAVEIVRQLRKLILDVSPDVLVYADIAMHPFGVMLSNLRLAPLQVLLAGHPAPSHSKQIDAFICEDSYREHVADYTEPVYTFPTERFSIREPLIGPQWGERGMSESGRRLKMVVPTTLHKITYPFLQTLKTIGEETGVEIHVTSNITKGLESLAGILGATVPGIVIHPSLIYDDFLRLLARCDFFAMSYPFAGYSTILDCFSQAVPGVIMNRPGIESQQGVVMNRRGGRGAMEMYTPFEYMCAAQVLAKDRAAREQRTFDLDDIYNGEGWRGMQLFDGPSDGIANTIKGLLDGSAKPVPK